MQFTAADLNVRFDLPEGSDVTSDGSVFGPGGINFAVYEENPAQTPRTDLEMRRQLIEGRSYVEEFTREEHAGDTWLVEFRTDSGELGFELGRVVNGRRLVFWSHYLESDDARRASIEHCRTASA